MIDLRTDRQKATDAMHNKIAARYTYYRGKAGEASDHQIFLRIGSEFGITEQHARKVCLAKGVAELKRARV